MIYLRGAPGVATTKIMFSLYENADHERRSLLNETSDSYSSKEGGKSKVSTTFRHVVKPK